MKKLLLFALILTVTTVFIFGAILAIHQDAAFAGNTFSSVSRNLKVSEASAVTKPEQTASIQFIPIETPNIGWNS